MKFEEVLPALRAGKKVRRAGWKKILGRCWYLVGPDQMLTEDGITCVALNNAMVLYVDDWEVVPEPKRVADYLCPYRLGAAEFSIKETHEVGKQPEGAVLVPGSEREEV